MLRWRNGWRAALLCGVLALLGAPAALAQSAGNQQYVDPLGSTTPTAPATAPAPSSSAQPAPSAAAPSQSSPAASSTVTDTSTTSAAPAASSSRTLPFTGLDLWPAIAVGLGLIVSGLTIRRALRPGR